MNRSLATSMAASTAVGDDDDDDDVDEDEDEDERGAVWGFLEGGADAD